MTEPNEVEPEQDAPGPASPEAAGPARPVAASARVGQRSLSLSKVAVLVAAFAFLAGAVGFVLGERSNADPLSSTDVGFMQDMGHHHSQAVQLSLLLADQPELDRSFRAFGHEIIIDQRYEQGVFASTLSRFGHDSEPGDDVMGWMGTSMPIDEMPGMATDAQVEELAAAEGDDFASLWIALMSEHHLAGLHMADYAARHGSDRTTVNLAKAMVKNQRSEVIDLQRYRTTHELPIPEGFSDPLEDQRLNPISFTGLGD